MKRMTLSAAFALASLGTWAGIIGPVQRMTPKAPESDQALMKLLGGYLLDPKTGKGAFAFIDAQDRCDAGVISAVAKRVSEYVEISTVFAKANKPALSEISGLIAEAGGAAGLVVVDEPTLPMCLVAPEGKWAIVNVAALAANGASTDIVAKRLTKELWRGFCFLGGSRPTISANCVMNPAFTVEDLDKMPRDMITNEPRPYVTTHYKRMGVSQHRFATYNEAVEEGWAPQPTNDYQKVIWDKIHAPPTKPIRITYDKDKQKPVVK